jgi:YggT family protein
MRLIGTTIDLLLTIMSFAILANAILSWMPIDRYNNPLVRILDQIVEPVLAPLRRIVPPVGMMDITPIVALIIIQVLQAILPRLFGAY